MKLAEIVNTVIDERFDTEEPVTWTHNASDETYVGKMLMNANEFSLRLGKIEYKMAGKTYIAYNVGFAKIEDGEPIDVVTNASGHAAVKILGAIVNGIMGGISSNNIEYDALIFMALDDVDKRMRIYNAAAAKCVKVIGIWGSIIKDVNIPNGKMTVVSKTKLSDAEIFVIKKQVRNK